MIEPAKFTLTSASQISTANLCLRKWWFRYILKLKEPKKKALVLGSALHSVVENYLKGKELYPEGWDKEISKESSLRIAFLIDKAILTSILVDISNAEIEYSIEEKDLIIMDGDHGPISLIGFIDVLHPTGIMDHKTAKTSKYIETPESLKKNQQLLIYAKAFIERNKKLNISIPENIHLRHNYFIFAEYETDPLPVVETTVTPEEVEIAWKNVKISVEKMIKAARLIKSDDWKQIDGFSIPGEVCNKYGGCCFKDICFENLKPETYYQIMKGSFMSEKVTSPFEKFKLAKQGEKVEQNKVPPASTELPKINPPLKEAKEALVLGETITAGSSIAPSVETLTETKQKTKSKKKTKTFTLLVDCVFFKNTENSITYVESIFEEWIEKFKQEHNISYWEADPFKRRDWLALKTPEIITSISAEFVVCHGRTPDLNILMSLLTTHATEVIWPIATP